MKIIETHNLDGSITISRDLEIGDIYRKAYRMYPKEKVPEPIYFESYTGDRFVEFDHRRNSIGSRNLVVVFNKQ